MMLDEAIASIKASKHLKATRLVNAKTLKHFNGRLKLASATYATTAIGTLLTVKAGMAIRDKIIKHKGNSTS